MPLSGSGLSSVFASMEPPSKEELDPGRTRSVLRGLAVSTRPGNVALTALSVYIGGIAARASDMGDLACAAASAALIAAGGYVINDVFDLDIDRVNRPMRPLPRGDLSVGAAKVWSVFLFLSGLILAWRFGPVPCAVATGVVIALLWYAVRLKRTVLAGNFLVAGVSATAFVYGGLSGPLTVVSVAPAAIAGAFHLGRELLKDVADLEGDSAGGATTVAVRYGVRPVARASAVPLALVILLTPGPVLLGWFGVIYLLGIALVVDVVLGWVIWRSWRLTSPHEAARLATVLKWNMLIAVAVLWGDLCFRLQL